MTTQEQPATQEDPRMLERMARLEGSVEQIVHRINDQSQAIDGLRTEFNSFRNTMMLALAGSWVTLMATIIGLSFVN